MNQKTSFQKFSAMSKSKFMSASQCTKKLWLENLLVPGIDELYAKYG